MLTLYVEYKRNNREPWRVNFIGNNAIEQAEGLAHWLKDHESYGFSVELKHSIIHGLTAVVDTHGKGGWEKPELRLVVNK